MRVKRMEAISIRGHSSVYEHFRNQNKGAWILNSTYYKVKKLDAEFQSMLTKLSRFLTDHHADQNLMKGSSSYTESELEMNFHL